LIFYKEFPILSEEAMTLLRNNENWYLKQDHTYLRIYGVTTPANLLPKYVSNIVVLGEIAYQTILQGFDVSLTKDSIKITFVPYNMYIGHYGLSNSK
jgi:hypothetical protein